VCLAVHDAFLARWEASGEVGESDSDTSTAQAAGC
jgi:hypothetical protein